MRSLQAWLTAGALVLSLGACKRKPWDKAATCERIRTQADSQVALDQWMAVCKLADDQVVKCMGMGGGAANDKDCAQYALNAPSFSKRQALVAMLNDFSNSPVPVRRDAVDAGPDADAAVVGTDEDHELWQAAVTTGDPDIMKSVNSKLGLADEKGTPSERMKGFAATHAAWSTQHADFVNGLVDSAKARAFVEGHAK